MLQHHKGHHATMWKQKQTFLLLHWLNSNNSRLNRWWRRWRRCLLNTDKRNGIKQLITPQHKYRLPRSSHLSVLLKGSTSNVYAHAHLQPRTAEGINFRIRQNYEITGISSCAFLDILLVNKFLFKF